MGIYSFSPFGYEGSLVQVEVDLRRGIPAFDIVGLADEAVKESRERVRAAIKNATLEIPSERVLISLSPADLKKDSGFDLPIACGIIAAQYEMNINENVLVIGELHLSGNTRDTQGIRAGLATAFSAGIKYAIIPKVNYDIQIPEGMKVKQVKTLLEAYYVLKDVEQGYFAEFETGEKRDDKFEIKFRDMEDENFDEVELPKGIKFAMTVAAAGRHNMLVWGSPGCGKTMALQRLPLLTPDLLPNEKLSVERIWSLAGLNRKDDSRPFRLPHQTASVEGMCGGGPNCRPGEISLAHNGILFLDEAAEFRSSVLQMLRVPIENNNITLARAGRSTTYPANFQLVMSTNPCPCGNYGSHDKICLCSAKSVEQYWRKFSAPLLDKMSIRFDCNEVITDFSDYTLEEARQHIKLAWERQYKRQGKLNSDLSPNEIAEYVFISSDAQKHLDSQITRYGLSPRAVSDIVKLAQTLCDMHFSGTNGIEIEEMKMACELRKPVTPDRM